jgi:hypothetical protein
MLSVQSYPYGLGLLLYFIHSISISNHNTLFVDLGVTISHNLAFEDHINCIIRRARQRANVLFRGLASRDIDILTRAFLVYIGLTVQYNSVVRNPCSVCLIN